MFFHSTRLSSAPRRALAPLASLAMLIVAAAIAPARAGETTLYGFQGGSDGVGPEAGLVADPQGALYGTTSQGGMPDDGTVFELTPPSTGLGIAGQWSESTLYSFCSLSNCIDGEAPVAGLIRDQNGALYGTTIGGGGSTNCPSGCGTVFKLTPPGTGETQWTESVLYSFQGSSSDGAFPYAGLIFGKDGALYGTTLSGGSANSGIVFKLTPPGVGQTDWTESILYSFCQVGDCEDGAQPYAGVIFDKEGALYGTTNQGGSAGGGIVFKLVAPSVGRTRSPPPAGQTQWSESVLYDFCSQSNCADGAYPDYGNLVFDQNGALYGTTSTGGVSSNCKSGCGTAFRLTPAAGGATPWSEKVLYSFCQQSNCTDGQNPYASLIFDQEGALYGMTYVGGGTGCGGTGCGTLFKLAPPARGQTQWTERVLHAFTGATTDGAIPGGGLIVGAQGALYGTADLAGSQDNGTVFRQCSLEGGEVFGGNAKVRCLGW